MKAVILFLRDTLARQQYYHRLDMGWRERLQEAELDLPENLVSRMSDSESLMEEFKDAIEVLEDYGRTDVVPNL